MKKILAIDSGPEMSAWIIYQDGKILDHGYVSNPEMKNILKTKDYDICALEMIASYGMAVGKSVFETCVWIGRFMENSIRPCLRLFRKDIKLFLCGSMRAKDGNIRQALIDLLGEQGTKKNKGNTYGISSHKWAALAVAVYAAAVINQPKPNNRNENQ
jgi:hypothetical protein